MSHSGTVRYGTDESGTIWSVTVRPRRELCVLVRYGTIQSILVWFVLVWYDMVRYSRVWYSLCVLV